MLVKYGYLSIRNNKKREHEHGLFVGNRLEKFLSSFAFVLYFPKKSQEPDTTIICSKILRKFCNRSPFSVHVAVYLILDLPRKKKKILNFSFIFYCYVVFLF